MAYIYLWALVQAKNGDEREGGYLLWSIYRNRGSYRMPKTTMNAVTVRRKTSKMVIDNTYRITQTIYNNKQ